MTDIADIASEIEAETIRVALANHQSQTRLIKPSLLC